ncbi:beta-mannosidase [Aquimarina sp. 2201CG14-23]|uniref:beta-mannosidase n=1 Tax=Aquimarina mycalae TaxID=3040073 RepID=UPI0024782275|nr:glycoside hydrolase family 2 protein [Aquimarina sp. 2201CG14-23]MDH7444878.1 glycoside hydrolase family 2 protein [Aquimarina sp. 2201CG14-23]
MHKKAGILLLLLVVFSCSKKKKNLTTEIDATWHFKSVKDTSWLSAYVPGTVHTDLLKNKKIEDPFLGVNEEKLQWITSEDWEYKTILKLGEEQLQRKHHQLSFEGIDTYAEIFLNDSLLLKTNNAFRTWKVDVSGKLQSENRLRVLFKNPTAIEEEKKAKLSYNLPAGNRIFSRKAQFHYGWDWGPKFITAGIWKPIILKSWDDIQLQDVYIKQQSLDDKLAKLQADILLNSTEDMDEEVVVHILINKEISETKKITLEKGSQTYSVNFQIENPKRWWIHTLGEPFLYDIQIQVLYGDEVVASENIKKGLRTIELITDKDVNGESFYFKLNGQSIFMKGANYIPQNIFQPEVTNQAYVALFDDVIDANMNMLRVWGGGIYENNVFYDLADEKGVLLWQDFMFACAMYPGDVDFLENVKQEAIDNVTRLRDHASIALWCGNNENNEAWHNWGWQANRSEEEKAEIWGNYQKLFNDILPNTVADLTNTSYWESSPKYGRGNPKFQTEGNAHDWGVWHDGYPFERFEDKVPRFMSEFGFQSFPSYQAIQYFTQQDSIDIDHSSFATHQKHNRGFALIKEYMERDFPVPDTDEDYVYVSQLLQAYGMAKGIEAHRRAKPYNMGSLYWQLNDCWPVVSWSGIDGLGNKKALHYKAKRSFENILISPKIENDTLNIYVVNDELQQQTGNLELTIQDFNGKVIWKHNEQISVKANASQVVFKKSMKTLDILKEEVMLISRFNQSSTNFYFVKPKNLQLPAQEIIKKVIKVEHGYEVKISSTQLQKDVFLYTNSKGSFSDNFFDLLPNEEKVVLFKTTTDSEVDILIKTLNMLVD